MIQPLENLRIDNVGFGGELVINWEYPDTLPTEYRAYIFKRSKTDITQAEIDGYFSNIADLSKFNYNGLFVFDKLDNYIKALSDLTVLNEVTYYYRLVLRDETSGEYSLAVGGNAKPAPTLVINVKDGKEVVNKALKKMFDNIYTSPTQKTQLGKDIKIIKNFALDPIANNYIMLERINGATQYKFWGQEIAQIKAGKVVGDIDVDVIRATFLTLDSPERRDTITNIFRANKQALIRLCKKYGARNCDINIEGDYYNPQVHGLNATGCTVIFSLLIENNSLIPHDILTQILGEIEVETR